MTTPPLEPPFPSPAADEPPAELRVLATEAGWAVPNLASRLSANRGG